MPKKNQTKLPAAVVPHTHKPEGVDLESWQSLLRRQYAKDHEFEVQRLDGHPVFTDYLVRNPESGRTYKVAIRDADIEFNYCDCLDFKTNQLGTCKHIEAVLKTISADEERKALLLQNFTPAWTSVYLSYQGPRQVKIRLGSDGDSLRPLVDRFFDEQSRLRPDSFQCFPEFLQEMKNTGTEFRCYDDTLAFILQRRNTERRHSLIDQKYADESSLAGLLKATLYPYQSEGIRFAAHCGRSLIADEMGLGKTIQAIGIAELYRKENLAGSVLIICPTSLKYQWQSEIQKFTSAAARVIEGLAGKRDSQYFGDEPYKIVSYHTAVSDIEVIDRFKPDLVILDEAQRIKNWKTKLARNIKRINSPLAVVLTGTPVENKLEELYSIIQFIDPFRPGPYHHFLEHHVVRDEKGKITGYKGLHEIHDMIADFTIRRTKKQVLTQLPPRIDQNLLVGMTEAQIRLHAAFGDEVAKLIHKWKNQRFLSEEDRQHLMINLNMQRMSCDSTYLIDQDAHNRHDIKIEELMNILDNYLENGEEKAVVFSQWERMTRLIAGELESRGIGYAYLHGGIPSAKRKDVLDLFSTDAACRVFLSTDAGSTGLNLQHASLLVNMDIPWNPAVLEQRIARIHRLGQKNVVQIINLVASETIEHRMLTTLAFKRDLAQGILDDGNNTIFMDADHYQQFIITLAELTPVVPPSSITATDSAEPAQAESDSEEKETAEFSGGATEREISDAPGIDEVSAIDETRTMDMPQAAQLTNKQADTMNIGLELVERLQSLLADPNTAEKLLETMLHRDQTTGENYLKIPLTDAVSAHQTLAILGRLFAAIDSTGKQNR